MNKPEIAHDYERFAIAYSQLGIDDTYYLAYRDIPTLINKYCSGKTALDHGCGTGRSTRFLKELGFNTTGVDINPKMLQTAKEFDPSGQYELLSGKTFPFENSTFDLIFQTSVAIELPNEEALNDVFGEISRVLKKTGVAIIVTGSPEGDLGEWASFICPNVTLPDSGQQAKVIIRGTEITLYDYVWLPSDYQKVFKKAGLTIIEKIRPIAVGTEPYKWYQEITKPCWDIYVLAPTDKTI